MPNRIASHESRLKAGRDLLSLAAAPTFAVMALLSALPGGGPLEALCAGAHDTSPLTGMAAMYVLMSVFHLAPWLRLITTTRGEET
ncbi:MAG: hypothetical protein HYZ40_19330 [Rhodospirillales bacterium]|nr:hypothetical protein [Rhodospirillales bacterium]